MFYKLSHKRRFKVVVPKGYSYNVYIDLAQALNRSLNELGYQSKLIKTSTLDKIKNCDICIVFAGYRYPKFKKKDGVFYILWQLEQIPRLGEKTNETEIFRFNQFTKFGKLYNFILDFEEKQTNYLKHKGYQAYTLKMGYHPFFEKIKKHPKKYKYDVLFYGRYSERRRKLLKILKGKCNIFYSKTLWGKKKMKKIRDSKICLNIHNDTDNSLEIARIIPDFISNKKFVISEKSCDTYPFQDKKHMIFCSLNKIDNYVDYYLKNDQERNNIANQGYNLLKDGHLFRDEVEKCIKPILKVF